MSEEYEPTRLVRIGSYVTLAGVAVHAVLQLVVDAVSRYNVVSAKTTLERWGQFGRACRWLLATLPLAAVGGCVLMATTPVQRMRWTIVGLALLCLLWIAISMTMVATGATFGGPYMQLVLNHVFPIVLLALALANGSSALKSSAASAWTGLLIGMVGLVSLTTVVAYFIPGDRSVRVSRMFLQMSYVIAEMLVAIAFGHLLFITLVKAPGEMASDLSAYLTWDREGKMGHLIPTAMVLCVLAYGLLNDLVMARLIPAGGGPSRVRYFMGAFTAFVTFCVAFMTLCVVPLPGSRDPAFDAGVVVEAAAGGSQLVGAVPFVAILVALVLAKVQVGVV